MKTKIIPFDLETAKKIQAGEIQGRILGYNGFEGKIITFKGANTPLPVIAKFHLNNGDYFFFVGNDGASDKIKLTLEVPDNEPQFKPFDKVLVREQSTDEWKCDYFSHAQNDGVCTYYVCIGGEFLKCIPYEGHEHLVGTTDKPEEE